MEHSGQIGSPQLALMTWLFESIDHCTGRVRKVKEKLSTTRAVSRLRNLKKYVFIFVNSTIYTTQYGVAHCVLAPPYGRMHLSQHLAQAMVCCLLHQAITWTDVDFSLLWLTGEQFDTECPRYFLYNGSENYTHKSLAHLPGTSESICTALVWKNNVLGGTLATALIPIINLPCV